MWKKVEAHQSNQSKMADLINFVSKSDLDKRKVQRHEERKAVLSKVSLLGSHASICIRACVCLYDPLFEL